jgi:hypothetical protein
VHSSNSLFFLPFCLDQSSISIDRLLPTPQPSYHLAENPSLSHNPPRQYEVLFCHSCLGHSPVFGFWTSSD